uniref:Reverse transcriptase Ty1/copia-type domain-containing protein n=1 Tax=Tanacetum cinerariifolium TaxID=118510 RepID=A0A6L2JDP7_TANCI|nr:hypothetical protein [Tanacetum cinerariifolium]
MKGSCKSLVELKFFLEEVHKAKTNQLDWNNPEGQQYLHNLLNHLPLIPNSRGRRVITFDHFINNDLEYLRSGASSRKIITVTKLQIVEWHDYKHLDWITVRRDDDKLYKFKEGDFKRLRIQDIEDMLLPLTGAADDQPIAEASQYPEWFQKQTKPPTHDHTLTPKLLAGPTYELMKGSCKSLVELKFFLEEVHKATTNQLDWNNPEGKQYLHNLLNHLPLIPNSRGKLTNLTVEERFAFNVSLRMFTRSIVIQRCMEDLQLGVESYQKKLNLTKPDTYKTDLKHKETYTAYSNPRGFIYQNKDKHNRIITVTELQIVEWHDYKHLDWITSNYVLEILIKYGMETCDPVGTLMEIKDKLDLDKNETLVDATRYRSMIGALMYLTSSRPDFLHATCLCARYQDFGFELTGFLDADYAKCKDTFKNQEYFRWNSILR